MRCFSAEITEPFAGWLTRLHQVANAAYEQLPLGRGQRRKPRASRPRQPRAANQQKRRRPPHPVIAAAARQASMGIYLTGLGSVAPLTRSLCALASTGNWSRWRFEATRPQR